MLNQHCQNQDSPHKWKLFPSLTSLFDSQCCITFIEDGPNCNIKAFILVMLSLIREKQCQRIVSPQNLKQISLKKNIVSFNESGTSYFDKNEENYVLRRFKILILSSEIDLGMVHRAPVIINGLKNQVSQQSNQNASTHQQKNILLNNNEMKKLLLQVIKLILTCQNNEFQHEQNLSWINSILMKYPIAEHLLVIFMRNIIYHQCHLQGAKDYQTYLHDSTVYPTLCNAFAINEYQNIQSCRQINSCKIINITLQQNTKLIFLGIKNSFKGRIQISQTNSKSQLRTQQTINYQQQNNNNNNFQNCTFLQTQSMKFIQNSFKQKQLDKKILKSLKIKEQKNFVKVQIHPEQKTTEVQMYPQQIKNKNDLDFQNDIKQQKFQSHLSNQKKIENSVERKTKKKVQNLKKKKNYAHDRNYKNKRSGNTSKESKSKSKEKKVSPCNLPSLTSNSKGKIDNKKISKLAYWRPTNGPISPKWLPKVQNL